MTNRAPTPTSPLDLIAIGLGPFNLGLACLMAPLRDFSTLFFESKPDFDWHPGMLIEHSTLQNPFLADLVTLADPTSPFSYLNFRKQQGRAFSWFLRENFYLGRVEYNRYCRWAASRLCSVRFGHRVTSVEHDADADVYRVRGECGSGRQRFEHTARCLVIGVGSAPSLPAGCVEGERTVHSAHYLTHKKRLQSGKSITVVGSGQSAAEVYDDLLGESEAHGYALHWLTRAPRFFAMDTSRFAVELLSPDYIDHFFGLPSETKASVAREHRSVYAGINAALLARIHDRLGERRLDPGFEGRLLANAELRGCHVDQARGTCTLSFLHTEQGRAFRHHTDGVIFATGYRTRVPSFIEPIRHRIRWDDQGRFAQGRNHAVDRDGRRIFVQNAGLHCHGFTGPDLGLACHRNCELIHAITGTPYYAVEEDCALQDFAPPEGTPWFELDPSPGESR